MPVYDFECIVCGTRVNDQFVHLRNKVYLCPKCNAKMQKLFSTGVQLDIFPAEGVHLEHVSAEGHTFHSKKEMRQYEKDHGVQLGYLGHA